MTYVIRNEEYIFDLPNIAFGQKSAAKYMEWRSSRNVDRSSGQHYFPGGQHYMPANTPGQQWLFIHVTWRALDQSRSRISDSDINYALASSDSWYHLRFVEWCRWCEDEHICFCYIWIHTVCEAHILTTADAHGRKDHQVCMGLFLLTEANIVSFRICPIISHLCDWSDSHLLQELVMCSVSVWLGNTQ